MHKSIKLLVVLVNAVGLSSCTMNNDENYSYTTSYMYKDNQPLTTTSYADYNLTQRAEHKVVVPDSYHVGQYRSPVSFKDRDKTWVSSQSPHSYTIEIADGEQAAQVAQKLYKAPKSDRMAQVQYNKDGKAYYKGVYGSYSTSDDAQKAMDALPAEVKQGANIKTWGSVQNNLQ